MNWPDLVFGLIGALAVLVPVLLWLAGRLRRISLFSDARLTHFLDDWFGEVARPGFAARPGIPERLESVEGQLRAKDGSSLRDAVTRIEVRVDTIEKQGRHDVAD